MIRLALPLLLMAAPVAAQTLTAPSGQEVRLFDVVIEPETAIARFRFVAPAIGPQGNLAFEQVIEDMPWLCEALALPALAANGYTAREVVVTLADREVPFGAADPGATQFIETYRIDGTACIWGDL